MDSDALDVATYIAQTARECWEEIWPGWKRLTSCEDPDEKPASKGACVPTSFALQEMLRRTISNWNWHVRGGRPTTRTPLGGYRGQPHLWVEGRRMGRRMIVDITSDQFDGPPVFVEEGIPEHYVANATPKLLRSYAENVSLDVELSTMALAFALRAQAENG